MEVKDKIHLVITSPPYWNIKDYGTKTQIGYGQSYQDYIKSLNQVWDKCYRVLSPGCKLVINIGDQFTKIKEYSKYTIIPIRTEIIKFCMNKGFDYMGAIIWQKRTTKKTTGGASIMGSYPYPRNGCIEIDYEFIVFYKKKTPSFR